MHGSVQDTDKSATQPELIIPHFELVRELRILYPPLLASHTACISAFAHIYSEKNFNCGGEKQREA